MTPSISVNYLTMSDRRSTISVPSTSSGHVGGCQVAFLHTRAYEIHKIEVERQSKLEWLRELFKVQDISQETIVLPYKRFIFMITFQQLPLYYIVWLTDLVLMYGGMIVSVSILLLTVALGIPLFMLFFFMGNYSKRGYLQFWQCIPILRGLGYSVTLFSISLDMVNITYASLSLMYLPNIFQKQVPRVKCDFKGAVTNCVKMNLARKDTFDCKHVVSFSGLNYLRNNKVSTKTPILNVEWTIAMVLNWFIIFIHMTIGFKKFNKYLYIIQIVAIIGWVPLILYTIFIPTKSKISFFYMGLTPIFTSEYWATLIAFCIDRNIPGSIVYFGSMLSSKSMPNILTLIVCCNKMFAVIVLIIWESNILSATLDNYDMANPKCLDIVGTDIIFAVVLDFLGRLPFRQFWMLLWLLEIYLLGIIPTIYTMTATFDSFAKTYSKCNSYRVHLCAIICCAAASLNLLFIRSSSVETLYAWLKYGAAFDRMTIFAIATVAVTGIYSVTRIADDYEFIHKEKLEKYWRIFWKFSSFFVILGLIATIFGKKNQEHTEIIENNYIFLSHIVGVLILLPIFCIMIWLYCKYLKLEQLDVILQSTSNWGPFSNTHRMAREKFDPVKEISYKMDSSECSEKCRNHKCLINTVQYLEENNQQKVKKNKLIYIMKENGNDV